MESPVIENVVNRLLVFPHSTSAVILSELCLGLQLHLGCDGASVLVYDRLEVRQCYENYRWPRNQGTSLTITSWFAN